jgi:hypothetical protein
VSDTLSDPLWERIQAYAFDRADDEVTFVDKLCREHGWLKPFALQAIDEYRRFAWLAMSAGHLVSPSDVVDQVWHMHLMYTRRYWDDWCAAVLGGKLHHDPATGRSGEKAGLGDAYTQTLNSYRKRFGDPPGDFWPVVPDASPRSHRRVDLRRSLIIPKPVAHIIFILWTIVALAILLLVAIR